MPGPPAILPRPAAETLSLWFLDAEGDWLAACDWTGDYYEQRRLRAAFERRTGAVVTRIVYGGWAK